MVIKMDNILTIKDIQENLGIGTCKIKRIS